MTTQMLVDIRKSLPLILFSIIILMLASCEDDLPTGYQEQYVIEAFLIEGQMIRDLRIVRSFPVNEPFDYEEALVRDATVAITDSSGSVFPLTIAPEGQEGYFYPDSSYKVQKNTSYTLNVSFADGRSAKGTAFVPDTFSWTQQAPDILNYPTEAELDTAEVFISWTPQPNFALGYLLQSRALDTLEYGIYLDPPTEEKNERVTSEFREDSFYDNTTTWGFLPSNQSVVVWTALRWYGLHEVSIYSADFNMLRWFLQARGAQQYNELLNTIEGDAVGCFGAASVIRDTTLFLFP